MTRGLVFVLALSVACTESRTPASTEPVSTDVTAAAQQVSVNGTPIVVTAYAWRNMMPGDASLDRRLAASLTIRTANGSAWPTGVTVVRAWVIRNAEAWVTTQFETVPISTSAAIQIVARGGPLWPIGDPVDVVVELRDASGNTVRVKSPGTTIEGPV